MNFVCSVPSVLKCHSCLEETLSTILLLFIFYNIQKNLMPIKTISRIESESSGFSFLIHLFSLDRVIEVLTMIYLH